MPISYRFEKFHFDPESGDLNMENEVRQKKATRLQPQPSKLLTLLLSRYPEVVTHEEIKNYIWPDVQVDLEGSIHFCIRQIRSALGDTAVSPKYIETISRRGYRWKVKVEQADGNQIEASPSAPAPGMTSTTRRSFIGSMFVILIALLIYLFSLTGQQEKNTVGAEKEFLVAIMPFQPEDSTNEFIGNPIAFELLERLTTDYPELGILGPTTTEKYDPNELQKMAKELNLDWVINGRFLVREERNVLFGEIIRVSDGAHIWVQRFETSTPTDSVVMEILDGVKEKLR